MENIQSPYPSDVVFTPAVKKIQQLQGSRKSYASMEKRGGWQTQIDTGLQQFLAKMDSFFDLFLLKHL